MPSRTDFSFWRDLLSRIGVKGDQAVIDYGDLVDRYSEPHRTYHTMTHIEHCLNEFDKIKTFLFDKDVVELALWYHDAVYDTKAKNNEEQSALLALEMLREAPVSKEFKLLLTSLILQTEHSSGPVLHDNKFLVDIDLAILGQSEERFDEYERQIRQEYSWVEKSAFVAGRSAILKSFLDRSTIYSTEFFRNKYEEQAIKNITRSLAKLAN